MIFMTPKFPRLYILSVFFLLMSTSSFAMDLSVPIGATGYLGEISAPVSSSSRNSFVMHRPNLYPNSPTISLYGNTKGGGLSPLPYFDEIGRSGVAIYNTQDPNGAFIVLAPSGSWSMTYKRANGKMETASATFSRSITTSMVNTYNDGFETTATGYVYRGLHWGILPRSGNDNFFETNENVNTFSGTITGYSVYAIGPLKPGSYTMYPGTTAYFYISTSQGTYNYAIPYLLDSSMKFRVNALKSCNITPQSSTNIHFPTQQAKLYSTPTKLAESIASINVSCPFSGNNIYLTLSPFNDLVPGSQTGMTLSNASGQKFTNAFAYVVASLMSTKNSICQPNAPDAIPFVGSTILPKQRQTDFNQNIHFDLCASGNIKADRYTGSINVSILIE